jgi:hypothetical protein
MRTDAAEDVHGTVLGVVAAKRPAVAARFEVISNLVDAGEAYHHTVTVDRSGRVRSVVAYTGREIESTPWSGANDPTADDLAEALIGACRDDHHESRLRLLSLVVHGLLPLGDHLWKVEIPDAVLDGRLGFGPRTSYRADIRKDVLAALRKHPALDWSKRIQTEGTEEYSEFVAKTHEAHELDPEWLVETLRAARHRSGVRFVEVVADCAPSAAKDRLAGGQTAGLAASSTPGDSGFTVKHRRGCLCGELNGCDDPYWSCCWGEVYSSFEDSYNGPWSAVVRYGVNKEGRIVCVLEAAEFFSEEELPYDTDLPSVERHAQEMLNLFTDDIDPSVGRR